MTFVAAPVAASAQSALSVTDFMGGWTQGTDCEEILRLVREWNTTRHVTIHTVGIGKQVVEVFLKRLAEESGGQYVTIVK